MSEIQFAKQFLTTLDNKSTKYQPDHIFDPKTSTPRIPYTLPRLQHPPHPLPPKSGPSAPVAPGAEKSVAAINVTLKSNRNPNMTLTLTDLSSTTTVQSLREAVQLHLGGAAVVSTEKIKIILNKKPIPTAKKTIADAFAGADVEGKEKVELGVMVMGGAPDPPAKAAEVVKPATPVPPPVTPSGEAGTGAADGEAMEDVQPTANEEPGLATDPVMEVLSTPHFWSKLETFLTTELGSPKEGKRLRELFENAFQSSIAAP